MRHLLFRRLFAASVLLAGASQTNAAYTFTDLGTLGGTYSYAAAINNAGQIVGHSYTSGDIGVHATLWDGGVIKDLGTLGWGSTSQANGINDAGQIVGRSFDSDSSTHATTWINGTITDLYPLAGGGHYAYAINSTGQIAGSSPAFGYPQGVAVLWHNGTRTVLGGQGEAYSDGYAINDNGLVVGASALYNGTAAPPLATLWSGIEYTHLGTLGGSSSIASDINNAEQIVGRSELAGNTSTHATLWSNGSIIDLGTLGGTVSWARAINEVGQIVGQSRTSGDTETHATLWLNGAAIDLNDYLDADMASAGWVLNSANDINNNGWIVGLASNSQRGIYQHAFLLSVTPVPEPEAYAMMLAGLGLVGVMARRRGRTKHELRRYPIRFNASDCSRSSSRVHPYSRAWRIAACPLRTSARSISPRASSVESDALARAYCCGNS